jgi:PHP family Zn ribbon phosphoesterase
MKEFRADLHIHSLLSPCGDKEMTPMRIILEAKTKGLDIIGLTDHNSTRQAQVAGMIGKDHDILILLGAELTTCEEIHCLSFFENIDDLIGFQRFLNQHLPEIRNNPAVIGDQVVVDISDRIIYEEKFSLASPLGISLEEIERKVHDMNGIFIPAHLDRPRNSIYSQLGFFPDRINADALELSWKCDPEIFLTAHPEIMGYRLITNSDAHYPADIGRGYNIFRMKNRSFEEIKMSFEGIGGRGVRRAGMDLSRLSRVI